MGTHKPDVCLPVETPAFLSRLGRHVPDTSVGTPSTPHRHASMHSPPKPKPDPRQRGFDSDRRASASLSQDGVLPSLWRRTGQLTGGLPPDSDGSLVQTPRISEAVHLSPEPPVGRPGPGVAGGCYDYRHNYHDSRPWRWSRLAETREKASDGPSPLPEKALAGILISPKHANSQQKELPFSSGSWWTSRSQVTGPPGRGSGEWCDNPITLSTDPYGVSTPPLIKVNSRHPHMGVWTPLYRGVWVSLGCQICCGLSFADMVSVYARTCTHA
jgi:hypothetical protein